MPALIAVLVLAVIVVGMPTPTFGIGRPARLTASSRRGSAPFTWPLEPHKIARPFQAPTNAFGPGHRGVDLIGDVDQPVLAAGSGVVRYAGRVVDRDVVSLEHPGGLRTTYEPVAATVTVGQQVTRGQQIGGLRLGHPACGVPEPKACLHWGARRQREYLDPLRLLGEGKVRLLPWNDPTS
jgi:murein DD-endopeptidase MepM/ murein hydrolase activator NlpD